MTKLQLAWLIAGLCACILLLALIILVVQLNLQRHLRAHSRALRNGPLPKGGNADPLGRSWSEDWRRDPTQRL